MSRPFKHPKTGVYYFRKGVPDDLRTVVGKREWKLSLRTKDPAEARRKHAAEAARVEAEWAELRRRNAAMSGPALAQVDAATIKRVGEAYYAYLLEEDEEQRIDGFATSERIPDVPTPTFEEYAALQEGFEGGAKWGWARGQTDEFFLGEVDEVLAWDGFEIRLEPASPSRKLVARELQAATIRAVKNIRARSDGEPVETPSYLPP